MRLRKNANQAIPKNNLWSVDYTNGYKAGFILGVKSILGILLIIYFLFMLYMGTH